MCAFYDRRTQSRRVSRVRHEKRLRKHEMIHYTGIPRLRYLVNAPASLIRTSYFVNVSKSMEMRLEGARTSVSFTRCWNSVCRSAVNSLMIFECMAVRRIHFFGSMHAKKTFKIGLISVGLTAMPLHKCPACRVTKYSNSFCYLFI